jgi:hypothetical protein
LQAGTRGFESRHVHLQQKLWSFDILGTGFRSFFAAQDFADLMALAAYANASSSCVRILEAWVLPENLCANIRRTLLDDKGGTFHEGCRDWS